MGWRVFTEEDLRFRIAVPPSWIDADRSPRGLGHTYEAMTKGGLRYFAADPASRVVNREETQLRVFADMVQQGRGVDSLARSVAAGYERGWEMIQASYSHVQRRAQDAVRVMLLPSPTRTAAVFNSIMQFYVVANGNWYLIEFHSDSDVMDALTPTFESIAATFLLLTPARAP